MSGVRLRRFDLYPDDMIAGTIELTNEESGVFLIGVAAIYSNGGPITRDHLRRLRPGHARTHQRIVDRLLDLGKFCLTEDGKLTQKRCEKEIENARKRVETSQENGRKGGRPFNRNNEVAKPAGFSRAREGTTTSTITLKQEEKGDEELGRDAPSETAAVTELAAQAKRALSGRTIRDPDAYDAAVEHSIWHSWLKRLSDFVMSNFDRKSSMPKLEAIAAAEKAGSREATSPAARKVLNEIDVEMKRCKRLGRGAGIERRQVMVRS